MACRTLPPVVGLASRRCEPRPHEIGTLPKILMHTGSGMVGMLVVKARGPAPAKERG